MEKLLPLLQSSAVVVGLRYQGLSVSALGAPVAWAAAG